MDLQTVRSTRVSSALLHLLHFPVYLGCIIWALYTLNKIEYASFIVPHCYCLSFRSCMQSGTAPKKTGWEFGNILHVKKRNAEKTMLRLQISQRAHTLIFLLCKNISFKIPVLQR